MCEQGHKSGHEFISNSNEVFTIYKVSYRSFWCVGGGDQ